MVFANTPKSAREAFGRLRMLATDGSAEVLLLTGRSREREAERTRARILDPVHGMASTREAATSRQRHLIVVATQTLEVGADIDAEYLVTEACGVRALTQRLGRLNRLGRHAHARAVYVHLPPPAPPQRSKQTAANSNGWPVYGLETGECAAAAGGCPASHRHGRREPVAPPGRRGSWERQATIPAGRRRSCMGSCGNG